MIDLDDPKLNEKMMQVDMCFWAKQNRIKLMGGTEFTLEGCEHLGEIVRDGSVEKCVQKGAQARITTLFMLDAIHGLIYNQYPQGVIYYFPTEKAVEGFSKTRFSPLVDDNPAIKKFLKNTNSVSVKKVGKAFVSLLGAKATQSLQGKKDGTAVRSTPADYVIRDERDLFDESMVRMSKDRLQNSKIGKEVDIGTPTIPDYGISRCFNESDQRYWLTQCESCNEWTSIVEEFPSCVRYIDEKPIFVCRKCGKGIRSQNGQWVRKHPESKTAGWLVSHLIHPNLNLAKIMIRWEKDQRDGKIGEFYNGVLGLPYISAEDRLRDSDVYACCGGDVIRTELSISETAMGVDIGKNYHTVVIGQKVDSKRAKVIYLCRVKGFDALHDIAKKYNVKSAVIDIRPYEEEFNKFQASEPYRVYGAEYKDKQGGFCKTDDKAGIYSLLRNQIFDKTHQWIKNQEVELPRRCSEIEEFAKQMCNAAKVLEEDEDTGDRIYRYVKLGDDHYRSAMNYLYMALQDLTASQGMSAVGYGNKGGTAKEWNPLTFGL
jgi:hypothetical protein